MTDVALIAAWLGLLAAAGAFCIAARRAGVALTYLRDLVHVCAGAWALGWPLWRDPLAPVGLGLAGAAATFAVPRLASRAALLGRFRDSISDASERWSGVRLYGVSFAAGTVLGFAVAPLPAAAALLALALGDGLGGLIGRRYGRHGFVASGAKRKTIEGSAAVAIFSALGIALAMLRFGVPLTALPVAAGAVAAALAEALAPEGTDNLLVPASVWLVLTALQGGAS
jgi:dolichol kinase